MVGSASISKLRDSLSGSEEPFASRRPLNGQLTYGIPLRQCVVTNIVMPPWLKSSKRFHICCRWTGSRPEVSSSESKGGSCTSAQASASNCRMPPERLPAEASRLLSDQSTRAAGRSARQFAARHAAGATEKADILLHGQITIEAETLYGVTKLRTHDVPLTPDVGARDLRCSVGWSHQAWHADGRSFPAPFAPRNPKMVPGAIAGRGPPRRGSRHRIC